MATELEYHSHVIDLPQAAPFDRPEFCLFSFAGEFVQPVAEVANGTLFWFSYYGSFVRFRLYTDDYSAVRPTIETLYSRLNLKERDEEKDLTLVGDLGHDRFLSSQRKDKQPHDRALLILRYLHSVSQLVLDNVQKRADGYWQLEVSTNRENPNGSNFESLHHLFCNVTQVPLFVHMNLWTEWMQPVNGKIRVGY